MKFLAPAIVGLVILFSHSCKNRNVSCSDLDLDFTYTVNLSSDSTHAIVCASIDSIEIPPKFKVILKYNGNPLQNPENRQCRIYPENGKYSIELRVTTATGEICNASKEFEITGIKNI